MNVSLILSIIATVLSVLTILSLVWLYGIFKDLVKISKQKDFINNTKEIKEIKSEFEIFKNLSKANIQKVGLIKFNPFNETGGDHSFSLALLDGHKNGIIITSLHTRERTRLYIKDVSSGKSKIELSSEEQKALQLSLK
ncbi:MAG: DUF4446 family protein [Microgenomates group bacterium]